MVSPAANNTASLSTLPDEVLVEVFKELPFDALKSMRITDKRFYGLISNTPVTLLRAMETFQDLRIALLGAKTLGKAESLVGKFLELTGMDKWEMEKWNWDALLKNSKYTLDDIGTPSANVRSLDLNQLHLCLQFFNKYARSIHFNFDHFYQNASSNRALVLAVVKRDGSALDDVDPSLKKDFEVVLAAVSNDGLALEDADASLKKDPEVALAAVSQNGHALQYVDFSSMTSLTMNNIILAAVSQNGLALEHVPPIFKLYHTIALAVSNNGLALKFADPSFQNIETIARQAAVQNLNAIEFATPRVQEILKKDKSLFLEHMQKKAPYFERMYFENNYFNRRRQDIHRNELPDSKVVNDAVEDFGRYADSSLKNDGFYVAELMHYTRGYIFPHVAPSVQRNEGSAKAAFAWYANPDFFNFLHPYTEKKLKKDKSIVLELTRENPSYFRIADPILTEDESFVLELIKLTHGRVYPYIPYKFQYDSDIIEAVHAACPWHIEDVNSPLHRKRIEEREALLKNPKRYKFDLKAMDPFFLDDEDIVRMALLEGKANPEHSLNYIMLISPRLQKKLLRDKSFALKVFEKRKNPTGIKLILAPVRSIFYLLDDSLKTDEEVALAAVYADRSIFNILDPALQKNENILRLKNENILTKVVSPKPVQQKEQEAPAEVEQDAAIEEALAAVDLPALGAIDQTLPKAWLL